MTKEAFLRLCERAEQELDGETMRILAEKLEERYIVMQIDFP